MTEALKGIQYTFFGNVHPERCNVSISEVRAKVGNLGDEIHGEMRYYISFSQITAIFICEKPVANVYSLKNYVEDAIRVALDALGYVLACGYDLEVTEMIDSVGNAPIVFGVGIPAVEKVAEKAGVSFEAILRLFADSKGGYLQRCLADLREAIRAPKDTGFFCYRAIESLRQFFVREKAVKDDKASWEILRSELGVDKADIDFVKDFADPVRHGDSAVISDAQRAKTFQLTWGVVNKFINYGNAGYKKAPEV
jgi:hypothetical protein